MLDPDGRHLLLDALRPPPGYELDVAVGTTYTLDLYSLLTAPVAFAMFDREAEDGSSRVDPIAALQALRRYAGRITLFCDTAGVSVPRDYRALLVYLEQSVVPVRPPNPQAIFHPKVWFIRYRQPNAETTTYRLLCMSRNLTFDRSWDTILRLEGTISDTAHHPELREFAAALPGLADPVKPISAERRAAILELAAELERVAWQAPDGMAIERFWPIGHDGRAAWPFQGRSDRYFVASPFVTQGALTRLAGKVRGSVLLSRPETFDQLGGKATNFLRERLVLSADVRETTLDQEVASDADAGHPTSDSEAPGLVLEGLHAKLVVADVPYGGRVWTGSANLTDAAFGGNVEFVTELRGPKKVCGVDAVIGDQKQRMGLRKLVEPYTPASDEGRDLTDVEQAERRLDAARRMLGRLRYTATCHKDEAGRFELELTGVPPENGPFQPAGLDGLVSTIRPVTLGDAVATVIDVQPTGLTVRFGVSYEAITPFFAVRIRPVEAVIPLDTSFLINAELVGAPEDRAENVMVGLLRNRADLIRFLLLLLGNVDDAMAAIASDEPSTWDGGGSWGSGAASEALLEPLVRAYSRDRTRLHEIRSVMEELAKTETGREILPDGWDAVWLPIQAALESEPRP
ncbi:MAG: phospholipase D family protein [Chloroflexota bacterium]